MTTAKSSDLLTAAHRFRDISAFPGHLLKYCLAALVLACATARAADLESLENAVKSAQSAGDNAWMLTSAALVLMMTGPGLALFYGGLVRKKNVLGTMMQSFVLMAS